MKYCGSIRIIYFTEPSQLSVRQVNYQDEPIETKLWFGRISYAVPPRSIKVSFRFVSFQNFLSDVRKSQRTDDRPSLNVIKLFSSSLSKRIIS
jgi:hypothetical protein